MTMVLQEMDDCRNRNKYCAGKFWRERNTYKFCGCVNATVVRHV